jgi:DNA-binding transcriptional LysR family regulator
MQRSGSARDPGPARKPASSPTSTWCRCARRRFGAGVGTLAAGELPGDVTLLSSRLDPWERWSSGAPARRAVVVDDAVAVVMQAEQGRGVALTRLSLVQDALRAGRLAEVGPRIAYRSAYYWVTPASGGHPALADRLQATFRSVLAG